jgi:hypothetical protein
MVAGLNLGRKMKTYSQNCTKSVMTQNQGLGGTGMFRVIFPDCPDPLT